MANSHVSGKRQLINKANSTMIIAVAVAAFLFSFSVVAGRALLSQRAYQARVIGEKEKAAKQLKENIAATNDLVTSYKAFVNTPENIIGGNPKGSGERDGDNAKIVLDALPSKYDYPALASSLEKIIGRSYAVDSITGVDDEVAQSSQEDQAPVPVEMPFQVDVAANFATGKELMNIFERSIRPMKIKTLQISSEDGGVDVSISAVTYYQPAKTLKIETKEVK